MVDVIKIAANGQGLAMGGTFLMSRPGTTAWKSFKSTR